MVPEPGEYVGPYEILGQIGAGGMGIVYRAWDERLHREVALKLLHSQYDTPNLRERFLIEARAASALNHPNICTIFDLGEQDGEPFLVMELLSGETLKEKTSRGALSTEEIVRISIEVSDALSWAHSKGVIHRDVKPANIFLLTRPGGQTQAKVLDFGLAKVTAHSRSGRASRALELTSVGTTVGTLAYMSPEQARGEALDVRSDLFSLGVLMYEMCTRRVPFRGATSAMVFAALLGQDPESIRNWNDAIPRDLERLVYRLLAKNRNERFQTAHELHEALRRLALKGEGDWLRKLPRPAVPLVPSLDPVARAPRGRHTGGEDTASSAEEIAASSSSTTPESVDLEDHMLRPRRLPRRESGPRESAFGAPPEQSPEHRDPSQFAEIAARIRAAQESSGAVSVAQSAPADRVSRAHAGTTRGGSSSGPTETIVERPVSRVVETGVAATTKAALMASSAARAVSVPVTLAAAAEPETSTDLVSAWTREEAPAPDAGRKRWTLLGMVALSLVVVFVVYKLSRGGLAQVVLRPGDAVLLAPIQNKTGEADLDRAIAQGLEIELAEHSTLHFDGLAAFRAGVRQIVAETHGSERGVATQAIAQRIGARAYLYGELTRAGSGYSLALTVVDAASNDRMASLAAEASSREGLPAAITDIAVALRRRLGEVVDARQPTPLAQQGTGSMAALQHYADAGIAVEDGRTLDAIGSYQRALAEAPGFALANVRLAWLLESQGAEVEAGEAAQAGQAASRRVGDRVAAMALYTRQALSDRDLSAATVTARGMTVARPQDVESLMAITRVMRLGGHMTEALLSSEQAVRRGPFHTAAYGERAQALVALGRYGEAARVRTEAAKAGLACPCAAIPAAYLSGGAVSGEPSAATAADIAARVDRALVFDNAGRLAEGLRSWKDAAADAQSREGMGSAAAGALAQAALDRALLGRCGEVRTLMGDSENLLHGPLATVRAGVASALCGLAGDRRGGARAEAGGLHSQIAELYLPMLRAAEALGAREPMRALGELSGVKEQRDTSPLALYLRGTAHLAQQQSDLAAEDFEMITAHRGRAFLSGSAVYGPALASLIRAQLDHRDTTGGARSRTELLRLYAQADAGLMRVDTRPGRPTNAGR